MRTRRDRLEAWKLAAAAAAIAALPALSHASAYRMHRYAAIEAWNGWQRLPDPVLNRLLTSYPAPVVSGAQFPDWPMGTTENFEARQCNGLAMSEVAHDTGAVRSSERREFVEALLAEVRADYMTRDQRLRTLAFLFGVLAHQNTDHRFDSGYLARAIEQDPGCFNDSGTPNAHQSVDLWTDGKLLASGIPHLSSSDAWDFPIDPILNAYRTVGCTESVVTRADLEWQLTGAYPPFRLRIDGVSDLAWAAAFAWTCPWANQNWVGYAIGGAYDLHEYVVNGWLQFLEDNDPTTTLSLSPRHPDGPEGRYLQPVTITAAATGGFGTLEIRCSVDGGAFAPTSAPIGISAEGDHTVDCRAVDDLTGIAGAVQSARLTIDLTPAAPTEPSGGCGTSGGGLGLLGLLAVVAIRVASPRRPRRAPGR